jgi:hypothetical protein
MRARIPECLGATSAVLNNIDPVVEGLFRDLTSMSKGNVAFSRVLSREQ